MMTRETRVQAVMAAFVQRWRWFCDGDWVVLEPPQGIVTAETMHHVSQRPDVHTVEAVFRATPSPGIYLRFRLREVPPSEDAGEALCSDCGDTFADHQLSREDDKGDRYCEDCREIAAAQCLHGKILVKPEARRDDEKTMKPFDSAKQWDRRDLFLAVWAAAFVRALGGTASSDAAKDPGILQYLTTRAAESAEHAVGALRSQFDSEEKKA